MPQNLKGSSSWAPCLRILGHRGASALGAFGPQLSPSSGRESCHGRAARAFGKHCSGPFTASAFHGGSHVNMSPDRSQASIRHCSCPLSQCPCVKAPSMRNWPEGRSSSGATSFHMPVAACSSSKCRCSREAAASRRHFCLHQVL